MFKLALILSVVSLATSSSIPRFRNPDSRIDFHGRIVGGSNAPQGAYPFIVSLRTAANSHFCGASILNNEFVLTAATCVIGRTIINVIAVVGTNRLLSGGFSHPPSRFIVHNEFDEELVRNDIALVELATSFIYSDTVSPTVLGTSFVDTAYVTLIGWGRLFMGGPMPNDVQQLFTDVITHAECTQVWDNWVTTDQVCVFTAIGLGSCAGDAGSPLIDTDTREQIGIVSFAASVGCAEGFPDVYVRISSYINWINLAIA